MQIKTDKKEFALSAIVGYFKNPKTCAVDEDKKSCVYLTKDGRRCVAGQFIQSRLDRRKKAIDSLITIEEGQENVFRPEYVGILTNSEWRLLQQVHDLIALVGFSCIDTIEQRILETGLFTLQELVDYAANN